MISIALIGMIVLYSVVMLRLRKVFGGAFSFDLGFIYLSVLFLYSAVPALAFIFLDFERMPGFPWQELAKLEPTFPELAEHLWRHILFFGATAFTYVALLKVTSSRDSFFCLREIRIGTRETIIVFVVFIVLASVKVALQGDIGEYSEKYVADEAAGSVQGLIAAVNNRLLVGLEYLILIYAFLGSGRPIVRVTMVLTLLAFEGILSAGSRIEILFLLLATFCLFNLLVYRVPFVVTAVLALLGSLAAGFIEVYRYESFDIESTLDHFFRFGISPPGEFGAVFLTGFHLYLLADASAMPPTDVRMFFFDFLSLFQPNSFQEHSPQSWYWRMFYPGSIVPPQTNGPISDSAIWGGGLFDLTIRGALIGVIFAFVANRLYSGKAGLAWLLIYVFFFSSAVMTLKYSVFWQLNPLVKTILPFLIVFYFVSKRIKASQLS